MNAAALSGRKPVSKHQIQLSLENGQNDVGRDGRPCLARHNSQELTGFGKHIHFPVQLIASRIGNLTRLTHTLLYVMTHAVFNTTSGPIESAVWERPLDSADSYFEVLCEPSIIFSTSRPPRCVLRMVSIMFEKKNHSGPGDNIISSPGLLFAPKRRYLVDFEEVQYQQFKL